MKNFKVKDSRRLFGIALVAVIGFGFTACGPPFFAPACLRRSL